MPDITMLDSHFTPYHSSSKNYATFNCSAHYKPDHGKITLFRVYYSILFPVVAMLRTVETARRVAKKQSLSLRLNLAYYNKLLPHYAKGTPLQDHLALTAYMSVNSSSISPVIYLLFIFSFTVLFTIAKHAILSLEEGSPLRVP